MTSRAQQKSQLIFGIHAVRAALRAAPQDVLELKVDSTRHDSRLHELTELARAQGLSVQRADTQALDRAAGDEHHQGVIARCRARRPLNEDWLVETLQTRPEPALLLVLDGVTDPHNLGACLRTAEAAGVHAVVAPHDRAAGLTPVVHKVSSGAASRIAFVQVANLARAMRAWQDLGVWITGASSDAQMSIYDLDLTRATALVMGAEGRGLRRLTAGHCDHLVHLPMAGGESLNVSVAAGICLYEAVRQRRI